MSPAARLKSFQSLRTANFTESVIREMTRLAIRYNAVNLAQGFPDFPAPVDLKQAAADAIRADYNQYAITWGVKPFRDAIAQRYQRTYSLEVDPESEVTVVCGATEGMIATLLATTDPDDEIVIFEPFYENYHPDTLLCGARRKLVRLRPPDWNFDPAELRAAFSPRTKAIIVNTPNNPTGKVFSRGELTYIASLCQEFDALAITDEIYEHITYDGYRHIPMITLPGMRHRSVLINSMSKTFSVTGWRVGWVIASAELTAGIRKVHDFLTVGAAAPLQHAGIYALQLPDQYFESVKDEYDARRRAALEILSQAGFECYLPHGAYYVMTEFGKLSHKTDREFALELVKTYGVAAVPGSSFYFECPEIRQIRFCFCKKYETLIAAGRNLSKLAGFPRA
jgi:aspartate/methionine/tyrosine aminotransferase